MKQIRSYNTLPDGYKEVLNINLRNKKIFVFLNVASVLLILPFVLAYIIYLELNPDSSPVKLELLNILMYVSIALIMIFVHELIHGIFFKLGTKEKISYKFHGWAASASVEGIYFYKNHYILTGIAPFILITPLLVASIYSFPTHSLGFYILLAMHTSGCIGDFYVIFKLLKYSPDTLIHDYGIGMTFYKK